MLMAGPFFGIAPTLPVCRRPNWWRLRPGQRGPHRGPRGGARDRHRRGVAPGAAEQERALEDGERRDCQLARPLLGDAGLGHVPGRAPDPALEYVGGRQAQRLAGAGVLSAKEGKRQLAAATERLRDFHRPALVAWASEDRVMPPEHGRRLSEILPEGRLVEIADSYTLIPLDQPGELAASIRAFMPEEVRTTDRDRVSPTGPGALSVGGHNQPRGRSG